MSGDLSGSQSQQCQGQGWNPSPKISLHPLTLPCFCAFLCAPFVSTLTGVRGRVGDLACCTSWPCSAVFHVCFLLLLSPQESLRLSCQKGLLNALLIPTPSFKKRRGHSIGGAPEQRYQSIPVCVAARLPTWAQDVLVRKSWATCLRC